LDPATPSSRPSVDRPLPEFSLPKGLREERFSAMGTWVSALLPAAQAEESAELVHALFAAWEQTLSRFSSESELSRLNDHAGEPVEVSPLLFRVLTTALEAARATRGLYDPSLLHHLVRVGYDRTFDELPRALPAGPKVLEPGGGWRGIQMDVTRRVVTLPRGAGVDLGGIAKGMAVDAAIEQLGARGIDSALVNAGGDLAVLGLPPGLDSWPIAVVGKGTSWTVPLHHGAMATSGITRRRWLQGTQQRHHLLDPRTGEPAESGLWSATAVAASCGQAEVAAKVAFLLGADAGAAWLGGRHLAGLLVREDGSWRAVGSWPEHVMGVEAGA
jgi:FAD:protein FMN transferase